jgi:hypothetical protein
MKNKILSFLFLNLMLWNHMICIKIINKFLTRFNKNLVYNNKAAK